MQVTVFSGILTQAVNGPDDLRPIADSSGSFSNTQQRWSATEKEALTIYMSLLNFNFYVKKSTVQTTLQS